MIHLKYLGEALFPTNTHHSMVVKDTKAQTIRKVIEEINVSCYKLVMCFMCMYAVFVILKMISGNNTLQPTLKSLTRKCLYCIHYCFWRNKPEEKATP